MSADAQAGWDRWLKGHLALSEDKLIHGIGDVVGDLAREYDGKLKVLTEQVADSPF